METIEEARDTLQRQHASKTLPEMELLRYEKELIDMELRLATIDEELQAAGGRLILTGVNVRIKEQLENTDTIRDLLGDEDVFLASDLLGESTQQAIQSAQEWLNALPVETE